MTIIDFHPDDVDVAARKLARFLLPNLMPQDLRNELVSVVREAVTEWAKEINVEDRR